MKRDVVVLLTRSPHGRIHAGEGLRGARGVAAGFDHHDVTVIFTGDGVYGARSSADRDTLGFGDQIAQLTELGGTLIVDRAAMERRGVPPSSIAPDLRVEPGPAVIDRIHDADCTLDF